MPYVEWNLANNGHNYEFQDNGSILPLSVVVWSGIEGQNPDIDNGTETLSGLNDNGYTFIEIADVIEKQL